MRCSSRYPSRRRMVKWWFTVPRVVPTACMIWLHVIPGLRQTTRRISSRTGLSSGLLAVWPIGQSMRGNVTGNQAPRQGPRSSSKGRRLASRIACPSGCPHCGLGLQGLRQPPLRPRPRLTGRRVRRPWPTGSVSQAPAAVAWAYGPCWSSGRPVAPPR